MIIFIKMPGRTNNRRSISGGSKESFENYPNTASFYLLNLNNFEGTSKEY